MATQMTPKPPSQRKSALLLCHWLYDDLPNPCKMEILVLCTPVTTLASGFDFEFRYEARVYEFDHKENDFSIRFVHQFPIGSSARADVAAGNDPLYLAFSAGSVVALDLRSKMPTLAAVYDSILLNTATPAALKSFKAPRL